jgi:hypothetical protein
MKITSYLFLVRDGHDDLAEGREGQIDGAHLVELLARAVALVESLRAGEVDERERRLARAIEQRVRSGELQAEHEVRTRTPLVRRRLSRRTIRTSERQQRINLKLIIKIKNIYNFIK